MLGYANYAVLDALGVNAAKSSPTGDVKVFSKKEVWYNGDLLRNSCLQ